MQIQLINYVKVWKFKPKTIQNKVVKSWTSCSNISIIQIMLKIFVHLNHVVEEKRGLLILTRRIPLLTKIFAQFSLFLLYSLWPFDIFRWILSTFKIIWVCWFLSTLVWKIFHLFCQTFRVKLANFGLSFLQFINVKLCKEMSD